MKKIAKPKGSVLMVFQLGILCNHTKEAQRVTLTHGRDIIIQQVMEPGDMTMFPGVLSVGVGSLKLSARKVRR